MRDWGRTGSSGYLECSGPHLAHSLLFTAVFLDSQARATLFPLPFR